MNTNRPPSSWQIQRMIGELRDAMAALQAIDPSIIDDPKLAMDTLEGMTEAVQVIDTLAGAAKEAALLAVLARQQARQLTERAARIERREDSLRAMLLSAMQTLQQTRIERPGFTVSVRQNEAPLYIDEAVLPDTYVRIKREPDRVLARKHLKQGIEVPGATLGNASQSVTITV